MNGDGLEMRTTWRHRMVRWLTLLVAMLSIGVVAAPAGAEDDEGPGPIDDIPPGEEEPPGPTEPVDFTWTMPSRFGGDSNGDAMIDYFTPRDFCSADNAGKCARLPKTHPAPIAPAGWKVDLNACASSFGTVLGATYSWEIVGGTGTITGGPGCGSFDLNVSAEGLYKVKVTVSSSLGTASVTKDVVVQDWLVVSMGDSYGSGEGNPDIDTGRGFAGVKTADAQWQDRRCHRTANAGSARAAKWLEDADPRTSVTFVHVSCSGAEALAGLLQTYPGVAGTWEATHMPALDPQITQVRQLVGSREIDALYVSIGGNDSNFARIVMSCIALAPCNPRYVGAEDKVHPDLLLVAGVCGTIGAIIPSPWNLIAVAVCAPVLSSVLADFAGNTAENWFEEGLKDGAATGDFANYRLTRIYERLEDALHARAPQLNGDPYLGLPAEHANRVFVSEYVDATQDDEGDYCPKGDLLKLFNDTRLPALGRSEYEWIDLHVERKLNEVIAYNASQNHWNLVDGIHSRYATHGICADDTYMVGLLTETLWRQDNITGAAHPNIKGHAVYRDRIISRILPTLYPGAGGENLDIRSLGGVQSWVASHAPRLPAQVPVVDAGGPYAVAEGATVTATNASYDDAPLAHSWESNNHSVATVAPALAATPQITGVDDGSATLTLGVSDDADVAAEAIDTATVTVTNVAPSLSAGSSAPLVTDEGTPLAHSATYTDPGTLDSHSATVAFGDGTTAIPSAGLGRIDLTHTYADDGAFTAEVSLTDDDGGADAATYPVTVRNVAPTVTPIVAPMAPVVVGGPVTATSSYADLGADDHTITWAWGDGTQTVQSASVDTDGPIGATHSYAATGVYSITLTVDDHDGGVTAETFDFVVVFDGNGGYVTGGGLIDSPAGALQSDPLASGPANFAFVSRYQKGANVPTGNTQFRFHAGGFELTSTSYQWLIVSGARAQYKGEASVNGAPGFGFLLSAVDGDVLGRAQADRLRLKVWSLADGSLVYDNQLGAADGAEATTAIRGGQISVNTNRK